MSAVHTSEICTYCTHKIISSIFVAAFSICIPSRLYFLSSPPLSAGIHASSLQRICQHFDSPERLTSYFLLYYPFHRQYQSLLLIGTKACGVISLQNPWKRHFPHSHRGVLRVIFREQKHVFKLDMAFNYFVAV